MADTLYTLHTNAAPEVVKALPSRMEHATWVLPLRCETPNGQDDCFFGWGDRQRKPECEQHIIMSQIALTTAIALAKELIGLGHQAVITDSADWYEVQTGFGAPFYYSANHTH